LAVTRSDTPSRDGTTTIIIRDANDAALNVAGKIKDVLA
jgi:hypothetical protein